MPDSVIRPLRSNRLILMGLLLGLSFWIMESLAHVMTNRGDDLLDEIFTPDPHELFMRIALISLILLFSLYAELSRRRQERVALALRESEEKLHSHVAALQESEEKFRALAESTPTAIMLCQDDRWIYANPAAVGMCGYTLDELTTMGVWDIVHPDHRNSNRHEGSVPGQGMSSVRRCELKIISKDGRELWIDLSGAATTLGGRHAEIISVIDITGRKASEEALQESEARYRTMLESIEEGYFELNLKGDFTFFNNSLCRILGYSRESLTGMNYGEFIEPTSRRRITHTARMIYECRSQQQIVSAEIIRGDKTDGTLEMSVSLILDNDQNPCGFRGIVRDVTDRKRLENQLLQAQKMEAIGTLAGGIAHDFNNLLMGIQGNASLLAMETPQGHPSHKRIQFIEQCVRSGSELTRQLLGFARGGKYEVTPTDINALIGKTSGMFEQTRKEIKVHRKLQEKVWSTEVDKGQLEQVLLNLYVNAWQAMPAGGELFIETSNAMVDKQLALSYEARPGRYVRISVADTGVGMDEKTLRRVFEPFFTTKEVSRGSGLGLASAYGIVRNHGGFITVSSKKNRGSTFDVYLPASDKAAPGEEDRTPHKTLSGFETILLVDDEDMILSVGSELLKQLGYKVVTAGSGHDALEILRSDGHGIDLVILDMIMPGMGGSETFDKIRELSRDANVILSSGYSLDSRATDILKRGCSGFIQKPFDIATLSRKIREVLDPLQPASEY